MTAADSTADIDDRAAIDIGAEEFRRAGHGLIDALADFYASLPDRPVTPGESVAALRKILEPRDLPERGRPAAELLAEFTPLLFEHSLHNGHPRFFGYITSSAAPLGALADLLAAGINQNCGLRHLSPAANEIERQTVDWLAELIGFPRPCGGIMVSGGNVANILALFAARRSGLPWDVRSEGLLASRGLPRVYCTQETHTWIQKAVDVAGLGTNAIHWLESDAAHRMRPEVLERAIGRDLEAGQLPFMVVATAGQVSTGAIDPLADIAEVASRNDLWFHVDGAYGAPAACLPEAQADFRGLELADSIALDPHKWLYAPIEAACTLVRDPDALRQAFSFRPPYYRLGDAGDAGGLDYFEHGLQNTRGFRALKVWLCLLQAGRSGYQACIRENIALAKRLFERAQAEPEIEAGTRHLSIATLRYKPREAGAGEEWRRYLNRLNEDLLAAIQQGGEAYVSNAVLDGQYFLRACIVNFRTRASDIDALVALVVRLGRELDGRERRR
jgi:glutamate/tyrosine decarboxylase-like PLP-dependent enzyme